MPSARAQVDVLVLGAGGVVGEAWMSGVLAGIEAETGLDFREVEAFVGTSAGSIVAASLAAGRSPREPDNPRRHQSDPGPANASSGPLRVVIRRAASVGAPLAPLALAAGAPGGALARRAVLSRIPEGRRSLRQLRSEVDRWGARFDGRLRICAVDRSTGRRVVFGAPGAPAAAVGEAVEASCAVPAIFRPVTIGDRTYVDGGAWSLTNLDVAPARRDTRVLCLTVAAGGGPITSPTGALRAAARPAVALEATALRRRGAQVRVVWPDSDLGANLLDPRLSDKALAEGHRQGLALGACWDA